MARNSFRDRMSGVLKAHGYAEANESDDVKMAVADDFDLEPGRWRWDGRAWVPVTPAPATDEELGELLDDDINVKALLLWQVDRLNELRARPSLGLPPLTEREARQGVIEKRKVARVARAVNVRFGRSQPK